MAVNNNQKEDVHVYESSKKKRCFLKSVTIILAVVLAIGGMLFFLMVQDENKGKYSSEPSVDIFSKLILASITTKEVNITDEEINGFLAYELSKEESKADSNVIINAIYVDVNKENNLTKIYIPITYSKISFGLSGDLDVHLNKDTSKIDVNLSNTKIGKLPTPSKTVAKIIANRFPEEITYKDSTVSFASNIKFYFHEEAIELEVQKFEIKDGNLIVQTKGATAAISKFVKDKWGMSIPNTVDINSFINGISNLFTTKQSKLMQE